VCEHRSPHKDRDDVIVGCCQLRYYEQDDIRKFLVPDIFVALGVEPRPDAERQTWRIWEEGGYGPDFVLEVTSKSTRRHDEGRKHRIYEELGVREYWQYDPTADYLKPELKGHRLGPGGKFQPVALERRGELLLAPSLLGFELHLRDGNLRFFDPRHGYLRGHQEEVEARREADAARRVAEARVAELERRLRGQ